MWKGSASSAGEVGRGSAFKGFRVLNDQADIATIAACQQGDPRAFQRVFELYKDRIYALCRYMTGNLEEAEDLAQDVFVSAFRNIGAFRAEAAFGTWLYRIAANRCTAELRRKAPPFQSFEAMADAGNPPAAHTPNPEDRLVRKEFSGRVEAAVAALPENLRLLFVLGTLEGMRYRDIAEIAGCSEDAVKMRVHRARKRVRDALRPYLET